MSRILILSLIAVLGLSAPIPAQAEHLTKEQIEEIIHDYLLEHPEVILESVSAGHEKQRDLKISAAFQEYGDYLYKNIQGMEMGNPDGDVTLVEFFDYNCGYCKRSFATIAQLVKDDPQLRVVFVEFPILGDSSYLAARYAVASAKQERYAEFHGALMEHTGPVTEKALEGIAKSHGMDWIQLQKDAESSETTNLLQKNHEMAQEFQLSGTPAFLIGQEVFGGAMSYGALKAAIKAERQKTASN